MAKKPIKQLNFTKRERLVIYDEMVHRYGASSQIDQAVEEMSELIQALHKHRRSLKQGHKIASLKEYAILDELADVRIMIEQLQNIFSFSEATLKNQESLKLNRQKNRLNL